MTTKTMQTCIITEEYEKMYQEALVAIEREDYNTLFKNLTILAYDNYKDVVFYLSA